MGSLNLHSLLLSLAILTVSTILQSSAAVDFSGEGQPLYVPFKSVECRGRGSIAECMMVGSDLSGIEMEFDMDSEINRRILATSRYISYEALKRNSVPCSRRGASYYNCRPGAQANPYSRGCSAITRCRS